MVPEVVKVEVPEPGLVDRVLERRPDAPGTEDAPLALGDRRQNVIDGLPELTGPVIAVLELVGGILLVLGWATRWLGLLFAIEMLVATFWVQMPAKGWNGSELERMLLASGITLFFAGAGKLAIDQLWPKKWV